MLLIELLSCFYTFESVLDRLKDSQTLQTRRRLPELCVRIRPLSGPVLQESRLTA